MPHPGRRLPLIGLPIQVSIEEPLQVVVGSLLVQIIPLLGVVDPQPILESDDLQGDDLDTAYHLSFDEENRKPRIEPSVCRQVE